jgi:hypothetical protein
MKSILTSIILGAAALVSTLHAGDQTPVKPYELKTCLLSGETLGAMGEPATAVYEGQQFKFCCSGCESKFNADPAKYLKQYQDAVQASSAQAK